ncbi:hypothetical protein BDN67DRAFT_983252 [Paxillus ammoniavirescens]|nr:hypothetical protein BDN67DRAFT_983252 [Paxillus ammoniavirescens]
MYRFKWTKEVREPGEAPTRDTLPRLPFSPCGDGPPRDTLLQDERPGTHFLVTVARDLNSARVRASEVGLSKWSASQNPHVPRIVLDSKLDWGSSGQSTLSTGFESLMGSVITSWVDSHHLLVLDLSSIVTWTPISTLACIHGLTLRAHVLGVTHTS